MIRANANADVNMKANPSVRTSMETGASASGNVKANAYAHAHTKTSATANAAAGRPARDLPTRLAHAAAAITLTVSGYIHAQLYLDGYRFIHAIGVMFLIQAAASFALATLLLAAAVIDPPVLVQLAAAGAALGALAGFAASRTVGVFGFTERGAKSDAVILRVEDNGCGVAPELADNIFDAYQTTKPRGMGLGLHLSRRIIQRHAGRLWWEPVTTGGARFVVELPTNGYGTNAA